MERLQRVAVIVSLVEKLNSKGSWSGETHVQKTMYFPQELLRVSLEYDFILYKHGPYSFDLSDDITAMRADTLLKLDPQPPYGPRIVLGEESEQVKRRFPKTIAQYNAETSFVAERLGPMRVVELERVATALYVTRELGESADCESRARRVRELKPHISLEQACDALRQVDTFIEGARTLHAAHQNVSAHA